MNSRAFSEVDISHFLENMGLVLDWNLQE